MTLVLPAAPRKQSFAQKANLGVGRGLQVGAQLMAQHQQQQQMQQENEAAKEMGINLAGFTDPNLRKEIISRGLESQGKQNLLGEKQGFLGKLFGGGNAQNQEQMQGQRQGQGIEGVTNQQGHGFEPTQISDADIAQATAMDPNLGRALSQAKDVGLREKRAQKNEEIERDRYEEGKRTSKEKEFFKLNEPKVMELADTQRKLETEELRYNRLGKLFSDPSKLPSSLTASLFTKDGNINDIVYSQLTPEAQEAIKLIVDSTSNIKDTYGARITNFDLQTYMKKLPSLLNSSEGKMRVLRDLKVMNQLNQMHAQGIQDIFDEKGGTDKIPYSKAEKLYKEKYGDLEKELKDKFINPEKGVFKDMPDANMYLGRKIKNPETGEIFISDGNEWKPFKG